MQVKLPKGFVLPPTWLRFLSDETATSLRISGYTWTELKHKIFEGNNVISIKELQKYQRPNPEKGLIDTIKGLAVEEPQHPPLYGDYQLLLDISYPAF